MELKLVNHSWHLWFIINILKNIYVYTYSMIITFDFLILHFISNSEKCYFDLFLYYTL